MNPHLQNLDFSIILDQLSNCAISKIAKDILLSLEPIMDEGMCQRAMQETTAAKKMIEGNGMPPLSAMEALDESMRLAQAGGMLQIEQLEELVYFCVACKRMTAYLSKGQSSQNPLSAYAHAFEPLDELQEAIEAAVLHGSLRDDASSALKRIRHGKFNVESRIKEKLDQFLRTHSHMLSDAFYAQRNGRYVLPVRKLYRKQFPGIIVDASRTGGTVFMEPRCVAALQTELDQLLVEEALETQRILYVLSDEAAAHSSAILQNAARMTELDVLFAKAQLSLQMNASPVSIDCDRTLDLRSARHPLLNKETCVPLDMCLNTEHRGMIITGPNTGGKTVTLKTIGLLTLMAQCGLHIPCEEGCHIPMRDAVYCNIGDSQSLSANLSTFSVHMRNVLEILQKLTVDSLVLLDELGSGTDPTEGMGIAIAILEALRMSGCCFMVTTHYPEVKTYVRHAEGLLSARMAFDEQNLRPLYKLETGKTGKSCALEIARRLGMPDQLLHAAQTVITQGITSLQNMPQPMIAKRHGRLKRDKKALKQEVHFQMGDSVQLLPDGAKGIVYQPSDEQGYVMVQIKGEKRRIRHNRLQLLVSAKELYPDDYDFSIIFDTVANRKARHTLDRRYDAEATIIYQKEEQDQ